MTNVIYRVHGIEEWIKVATDLKQKHDWSPKYWLLGDPEQAERVENEFPNCITHLAWQASKSVPPEDYSNSFQYPIKRKDMRDTVFEMSMSIKGMDRNDPSGGREFEYDKRLRHHFRLVMWWRNVIEDEDIGKAVFARPPHTPEGYTLYIACKQTDTDVIFLKEPIPLTDLIYSQEKIGEDPINEHSKVSKLPERIEKDITDIKQRKSSQISKKQIRKKRIENYSYQIKRLLGCCLINPKKINETYPRPIKKSKKDIEESQWGYLEEKLRSIKEEYKKIRLYRAHNKLSSIPDYSEDYVYFPLQYQPELTSNPKGGLFVHQFLVANFISSVLPEDTKLIIKEHPVQLFGRRPFGRNTYHYKHLQKLDNVEFANIESDQMKLIDNAKAIATMTGTPGWEGILRGTPALVFGNAWYRKCKGAYQIDDKQDILGALDDIKNENIDLEEKDVREFLMKLSNSSSNGYVDKECGAESDLSVDSASKAILNEIEKYIAE